MIRWTSRILLGVLVANFHQESVYTIAVDSCKEEVESNEFPCSRGRNTKEEQRNDPRFVTLHDGRSMPKVGLGVALTGDRTQDAVAHALAVGYRLVDTAAEESYGNEDQVGRAIANQNSNVFVTTKLWDTDHGFYHAIRAFFESYQQINEDCQDTKERIPIDLYLVHSPYGGRLLETWDALLYLQQFHKDKVKSIGVSNFGIEHLEVIRTAGRPMPVVNQIEMHPLVYNQRKDLLDYCQSHNIQVQAFGSLMHGYDDLLDQSLLLDMVKRYDREGASPYRVYNGSRREKDGHENNMIGVNHVLLQWALQHNFAIIPKSSRKERITDNVRYINLGEVSSLSQHSDFVLSQQDMEVLDNWGDHLPYGYRNIYKRDWNWNPIDEAPIHIGRRDFWPDFREIDPIEVILENQFSHDDDYWGEDYDEDEFDHENEL